MLGKGGKILRCGARYRRVRMCASAGGQQIPRFARNDKSLVGVRKV
jgi:hypothetical protein